MATLDGLNWQSVPYQPTRRAGAILGVSQAQIYKLLHAGDVDGVKIAGRTLIATESLVKVLAAAQPWRPDPAKSARISTLRKAEADARSGANQRALK